MKNKRLPAWYKLFIEKRIKKLTLCLNILKQSEEHLNRFEKTNSITELSEAILLITEAEELY